MLFQLKKIVVLQMKDIKLTVLLYKFTDVKYIFYEALLLLQAKKANKILMVYI